MRWIGVLAILAYRAFVRPFMRRRCLYPESCSTYGIRMLTSHGLFAAVPRIRERVRSCRMPTSACFVIGDDGRARLLDACGHDGVAPPPQALELLARDAELAVGRGAD